MVGEGGALSRHLWPESSRSRLVFVAKTNSTIQPNVKYNGPKNAETQGEVSYIFFNKV